MRNRNKEASMETVDEEDKENLSLSIDTAVRDARAHLHQIKDQNDVISLQRLRVYCV